MVLRAQVDAQPWGEGRFLGYSCSTRSCRPVLAGTCVRAYTWACANGCHCVPECCSGVYVGGQVAPSCLQGAMDGFQHWASFSLPDVLTGLSVCLLMCPSCRAACVQSPEPVSSIPSSPALPSSVALPLPCATQKYQNVWVRTSTHASLISGPLYLSDVPMSPFQTSFPIVKAHVSQHPSFCLPFEHIQREAGTS